MSKRTVFTTLTALPAGISRETVVETLHSHTEMIDLNPLVEERHPIKAPPKATPEEFHCIWYSMTDKIHYLPGGLYSGNVTYSACFHDLVNGVQTHCYAPMGLDIKGKWTLGGTLPHEPREAVEIGLGAPKQGLWLREDVDMKCNIIMTSFVKRTLKKAHATLVARLVEKSHLLEAEAHNSRIWETKSNYSYQSGQTAFQSIAPSPDPSNLSHYSGMSGSSSGFPPPARMSSPDSEGRDRTSGSQHPSAWSTPSMQHVDPAYQQANPYASDATHQSFQSLEARHQPYHAGDSKQQGCYPGEGNSKPQQPVELPSQYSHIAELDAPHRALMPAPLRPAPLRTRQP